jgi:spore germination cell wall hydrolase CwlJ-like protein
MTFGFSLISASTTRLIILTAASAFLLAAGDVSDATLPSSPTISDDILAPMTAAEAAASTKALADTTPADIAAAMAAPTSTAAAVETPRAEKLPTLVAAVDDEAADAVAADAELRCLATAVYFESRGEPLEGQLAVAQAILNRVESGRYAHSVCGVIAQPKQFSFDRTRAPRAGNDWLTAQAIAKIATDDLWKEVAPRALSFHATYVAPNWAGKTRIAQIGRHVFYR